MNRDIRETNLYREAQALQTALRQPGTGQISDAAELHVSADGRHVAFAGTIMEALEGMPTSRICQTDLTSGDTRVLTFGPNTDRLPKYSPDGRYIAFLSDRHKAGDFQLYLLHLASGAARPAPAVDGWVEYLHWSPDGKRILLGVAGHGADIAGGQGAIASQKIAKDLPSWLPAVDIGDDNCHWRRAWILDVHTDRVQQVSAADFNIWESEWCGDEALAAVASPGPGEGLWYSARLYVLDLKTGTSREIFRPQDQLGWPAASPMGKHLAIVEAVCSDRWVVAGDLRLIETESGEVRRVHTRGVDITCTEWRSERKLLLAGHRGLETVVGMYDAISGTFSEVWSSRELTSSGFYVSVSGFNDSGDFVLAGRGFTRAPEIAAIRKGRYESVKSFEMGCTEPVEAIGAVESVNWKAPDGLDIQGWLLLPKCKGPHPLVMNVHGGPVWRWPPMWLGAAFIMLLNRGYALFFPNPRGSSGRGQDFARLVVGELGGADTCDCLSGLDYLVAQGIADPKRLGVTGASYGGFMTSWLITQDSRFAAAVPVAPVTNHVTQHLISNIPNFVKLFLADTYANPNGKYFQRSPITHAHKVKTPTLNICGALDRCTPPEEAVQFHNALLENGVKSVLVTYPEEGHGIRKLPAVIDFAVRLVAWIEEHMPPQN